MVRRHDGMPFMGGAHVFPGGAVDPADQSDADAAIRELFEEAGILLARDRLGGMVSLADPAAHERFTRYRADVHARRLTLGDITEREALCLAADALVLFAHWVTPPVDSRRYDTRFFVARAPSDQVPGHDERESTDGVWITAADALSAAGRRDLILPPPTWCTLRELERFTSVDAVLGWAEQRTVHRREPRVVTSEGSRQLVMPGDPSFPEPADAAVPYETRFVWTTDRWLPCR